jgi:hypothetical protein
MKPALSLLLLPILACDLQVEEITLSGVILDAPYGAGDPVEGVEVTTLDGDLEAYSTATSDATGLVTIPVAAGQDMFLELRGDGAATTLFAGESGLFDLTLEAGELYTMPASTAADRAAEFGDCAQGGSGGLIEGEVRIFVPGGESSDEALVGNAWVVAYDAADQMYEACYLDENGEPAPDEQTLTNSTGRFAIFGVPAGPYVLEVAYTPGAGEGDTEAEAFYWFYKVNMVDDGVAPFYPAWVEFVD